MVLSSVFIATWYDYAQDDFYYERNRETEAFLENGMCRRKVNERKKKVNNSRNGVHQNHIQYADGKNSYAK
jgi:hypothetical protein